MILLQKKEPKAAIILFKSWEVCLKTRNCFRAHFFVESPIKPIDKVGNEAYIPIHTKQVGI